MKIPQIEMFIKIDPDTEECITQIGNILADDYHIYTDMKEIIVHAIFEMYFGLRKEPDIYY